MAGVIVLLIVVSTVLAGFYSREIYVLGQVIQVGAYHGTLEAIDTLKATLSTEEGQITVPNSLLIEEVVVGNQRKH
jgi:hypothetical protein